MPEVRDGSSTEPDGESLDILAARGADELTIGVVMGTMAASAVAMRPLVGRLLDTRGRHVIARWGFWHFSRFSAEYRRMYGELPSQTLRGFS